MHRFKFVSVSRVVFYSTLIAGCVLAFAPANQALHSQFNDKLLHCVGFFVLALLAHLAHPRARMALLLAGLALFGLGIELVQAYLPYRSFSWLDWLADILGAAMYFLLFARFLVSPLLQRYKCVPD